MTDLEKRVSEDLLSAMKSKKEMEVSSLRMLKAEFQKAKTEKGRTGDLTEEEVLAVIQRLVKQKRVTKETALLFAANPDQLKKKFAE